jgi:hypothetical protein
VRVAYEGNEKREWKSESVVGIPTRRYWKHGSNDRGGREYESSGEKATGEIEAGRC